MHVTLILDPNNHRDRAIRNRAIDWLHHTARRGWMIAETEIDDDDDDGHVAPTVMLTFDCQDILDADDLYRHLAHRARRS